MTEDYISRQRTFSDDKLTELRTAMAATQTDAVVVTCGSFARRDATSGSDLDFFSIYPDKQAPTDEEREQTLKIIDMVIGKRPSEGGAFAKDIPESDLLRDYGGSNDTNEMITRRMLLLLEGQWLTNKEKFEIIRTQVISRYVDNTKLDHQLAFYLLNDIIRYWRTLAVDYADKTYGQENPKPWAVRNIKLVYSRKLIYASGLFSVALTCDRRRDDKIELLNRLFDLSPMERLEFVSGDSATKRIREIYGEFLMKIDDSKIRNHLENLPLSAKHEDEIFRRLKNEGHYFSRELFGLMEKTFHSSHPIHMAVVF